MSFTSKTLPGLTVNIREKAPTASHGDGGEKTAHFKICPECSVLLNNPCPPGTLLCQILT